MRIDLNPSATTELMRSSETAAGVKPDDVSNRATANAEDVAELSSGSDSVRRLKTHLESLPDIRQERVDALQQAIRAGTYRISPESIASAMLADAALRVG